jgi:hypothetical protein
LLPILNLLAYPVIVINHTYLPMSLKTIILLLVAISLVHAQEPYKKIVHSTDPDALCLDGTPPLLYLHEGTEKNKFLIFFFGGGLCTGMTLDETI